MWELFPLNDLDGESQAYLIRFLAGPIRGFASVDPGDIISSIVISPRVQVWNIVSEREGFLYVFFSLANSRSLLMPFMNRVYLPSTDPMYAPPLWHVGNTTVPGELVSPWYPKQRLALTPTFRPRYDFGLRLLETRRIASGDSPGQTNSKKRYEPERAPNPGLVCQKGNSILRLTRECLG